MCRTGRAPALIGGCSSCSYTFATSAIWGARLVDVGRVLGVRRGVERFAVTILDEVEVLRDAGIRRRLDLCPEWRGNRAGHQIPVCGDIRVVWILCSDL